MDACGGRRRLTGVDLRSRKRQGPGACAAVLSASQSIRIIGMKKSFASWIAVALLAVAGCGTPSFLITPISNLNKLDEETVASGKGLFQDKILVIGIDGLLANAKAGGFFEATENPVSMLRQELDKAADDSHVKAIVLRVNSPGGTVSGADAMYEMVMRFKAKTKKPVIASAQEVDASGAYYVSCAADKIVAQPTSLVGSIGVIFEGFDVSDTLAKLGIAPVTYRSADEKDLGSPFRKPTAEDKKIMQGLIDESYVRFKAVVTEHRAIASSAQYAIITDGRVFSGDTALKLGLVDQTGMLEDAIELAKSTANTPNAKVVIYTRPHGYSGSIYATGDVPAPRANVTTLQLPEAANILPAGFYYLWKP
jgi:protease-4